MKYSKILLFLSVIGIISIPIRYRVDANSYEDEPRGSQNSYFGNSPDCVKLFSSIEKHSKDYKIPLKYALGIAYAETRYQGPFDWDYNSKRESPAGALGPMQIMPGTARWMWRGEKITREKILSDIDFNVQTSMKLLRHLYDRYKDWKTVFGCYNTGRPCVNSYAEKVYNYKPK